MELSQMYSLAGDKDHAMDAVERVASLKTRGTPGYDQVPWEKIWFQEGTIEFWYNDLDSTMDHLKKVVARSDELDLNTVAYAYLRIGQIYDMTGRRSEALRAYSEAIAVAPKSDAVPQCRRYLGGPYRRN
jgi:tetratricopeptide (TPR) repeat protein